jgi:hypothetical protein
MEHGPNSWQKYSILGPKSALFNSNENKSNDNSLSFCNLVPACELLDRRFSYMVRETLLKISVPFSFGFKLYRRSVHLLEHPYPFYPNFISNSARIASNIYRSEKCFKQTLLWKIKRMFYVHFVFPVVLVSFEVIKRKNILSWKVWTDFNVTVYRRSMQKFIECHTQLSVFLSCSVWSYHINSLTY